VACESTLSWAKVACEKNNQMGQTRSDWEQIKRRRKKYLIVINNDSLLSRTWLVGQDLNVVCAI